MSGGRPCAWEASEELIVVEVLDLSSRLSLPAVGDEVDLGVSSAFEVRVVGKVDEFLGLLHISSEAAVDNGEGVRRDFILGW